MPFLIKEINDHQSNLSPQQCSTLYFEVLDLQQFVVCFFLIVGSVLLQKMFCLSLSWKVELIFDMHGYCVERKEKKEFKYEIIAGWGSCLC